MSVCTSYCVMYLSRALRCFITSFKGTFFEFIVAFWIVPTGSEGTSALYPFHAAFLHART